MGVLIGAVMSRDGVVVPKGDTVLKPNDRAVIFCMRDNLPVLQKFFQPRKKGVISELFDKS